MKEESTVKKIVLGAMFLSVGIVLPFFTGQIPQIGSMLLPMHIPVFLCGLICGGKYGAVIGFVLPLMRSALFIMPPMFPDASAMAFELSAYGFVVGFLYEKSRWHCIKSLFRCMIIAMLSGRIVWGIAMALFLGIGKNAFTAEAFIAGAFINSLPGIVLQFVTIPGIMLALEKTHLMPCRERKAKKTEKEEI
ncbi:MAG: ECF transporter S component [Ruminococcaceae bacterium]|nr:ECF transporter S component [Oscillospiraceae bacterium]